MNRSEVPRISSVPTSQQNALSMAQSLFNDGANRMDRGIEMLNHIDESKAQLLPPPHNSTSIRRPSSTQITARQALDNSGVTRSPGNRKNAPRAFSSSAPPSTIAPVQRAIPRVTDQLAQLPLVFGSPSVSASSFSGSSPSTSVSSVSSSSSSSLSSNSSTSAGYGKGLTTYPTFSWHQNMDQWQPVRDFAMPQDMSHARPEW